MSCPSNLVIVVPPGTRVRYMESPAMVDKFLALDADQLGAVTPDPLGGGSLMGMLGISVFDAAPAIRP